jgi:hypothetical protein
MKICIGLLLGTALWIVFTCGLGAREPVPPKRFDIICKTYGRTVLVNKPGRLPHSGRLGPSEWSQGVRYAIDLVRMRYQGADWVNWGPQTIKRLTKEEIIFNVTDTSVEKVNLQTYRYDAYGAGAGFIDEKVTGKCRLAPFSGFH